jgi:hypothetical protein
MNWRLILYLSLFGFVMAFATLLGLIQKSELPIWLFIYFCYSVIILRHTNGKYFLHSFITCILNGVYVAVIHAALFSTYLANNPEIQINYSEIPKFLSPQIIILIFGPVIGACMGIIAGLIASIYALIVEKIFRMNYSKHLV